MYVQNIKCPCCGRGIMLGEIDYNESVLDITCKKCGSALSVGIKLNPTFTVTESSSKTCLECGDELHNYLAPDMEDRVKRYADLPSSEYCLCNSCTSKLKLEENVGVGFQFVMRKRNK